MRAVIVAAVSTAGQAQEDKYSIPQQLAACREVCTLRGWQVVSEIVIPGHSRNYNWLDELCTDCPEYAQLMKTIRSGAIDLVIVRDYDRLWRTDALRAQVMAVCREHKVQVFSLNQPVEPVSPDLLDAHDTAKLSEVLFGFISEQENRTRVRRWRAGMEGRWRRGLHGAVLVIPYGYKRNPDKNGPMLVDEPRARWVRQIYAWRLAGYTYRHIAIRLNELGVKPPRGKEWYDCSVRFILTNPTYCGLAAWQGQMRPGLHEPIISEDVWRQAQAIHSRPSYRYAPHSVLSGLLRCGYCGGACCFQRKNKNRWYAQCTRYTASGGRKCRYNAHYEDRLLPAVLAEVKRVLRDPAAWQAALNEDDHQETEIAALEAEIAEYERRWQRWDRLYEIGSIDAEELLRHRQELLGDAERARQRLEELRAEQSLRAAKEKQYAELAQVVDNLDTLPFDDLRAVLHALIRCIVLTREGFRIEWW